VNTSLKSATDVRERREAREGSSMKALAKRRITAFAVWAGAALLALAAATGEAARGQAPFFTHPASPARAPDPNGFLSPMENQ
jgi:hypothetical protein